MRHLSSGQIHYWITWNRTLEQLTFPFYLLVLLATILNSCAPEKIKEEQIEKPNIVLIFTDELQFSDIGAYGGELSTPEIDRLAREGIRFTKAYTTASMCTPSRFSVLTGLFPGRCTAPSFLQANPKDQPYNIAWNTWITSDLQTLPETLKEGGYVTGMAGKWHVGKLPDGTQLPELNNDDDLNDPDVERKLKTLQQIYREQVMQDAGFDYASSVVWHNFDNHPIRSLRFHNFAWINKGALDFLDQQADSEKPFFLYLTPTAIHGPNHMEDLSKDKTLHTCGKNA